MSNFKNKPGVYKGNPVTIIRLANGGDVDPGTKLTKPHFLIVDTDGKKAVVLASDVKPNEDVA